MIENFFQSLDRNGVEYLLISGQATVLYGAATFSEDIDLWIRPAQENRDKFVAALCECHALYYKLTPQFTLKNLQQGHGFHFLLPAGQTGDVYLDVMGNPPRAGSFTGALATARWMETEWGLVRTIGLKPLVELKKTQRLADYPIIGRLALLWFDQTECANSADDHLWAVGNIFTLPELVDFFTAHPAAVAMTVAQFNPDICEFGQQIVAGDEPMESTERRVGDFFQAQISHFQQADRQYWRNIIRQLKELRAVRQLTDEGTRVSASD